MKTAENAQSIVAMIAEPLLDDNPAGTLSVVECVHRNEGRRMVTVCLMHVRAPPPLLCLPSCLLSFCHNQMPSPPHIKYYTILACAHWSFLADSSS